MPLVDYARTGTPLTDVPVLDVHAHLGAMYLVTLEQHVATMDRLGIRVAAVSSTLALSGDIQRGNDEVAAACQRFPNRFIGYCHVSANYPELIAGELARGFARPGFRGIKIYQVGPAFDDPLFTPVWEFARARRLPVLAHTWGGDLTGLDRAAAAHPEVAFLAAHTGSGFAYRPYIDAARRVPNLYLDLTYSREHTNMIEHIVSEVSPDRIVWGSDSPCFSMSQQLSKILFARIPDDLKKRIIYDNGARLFRLAELGLPAPAAPAGATP